MPSIRDLREAARRRLPRMVFDFVDGGAQDERTLGANARDFDRWTLAPRVLRDVAERGCGTVLLGRPVPVPLAVAPTGLAGLVRRRGDVLLARAAEAAGIPFCLSTNSVCSLEEVAREAGGDRWFQLYVMRDRGLTRDLVRRARGAGYRVLCLTVDLPVPGMRERDARNGFTIPPRPTLRNCLDLLLHARWGLDVMLGPRVTFGNLAAEGRSDLMTLAQYVSTQFDPSVTWRDLEAIRAEWDGPLLVKGVLRADDAATAVDLGADAVAVSNHGGRQLDGVSSPVAALPAVVEAVGGRAQVLLDGGVRRGTDIVKALALGATACMVGRPCLYGLAAAGEAGVGAALRALRDEFDNALALVGCPQASALDRSYLVEGTPPHASDGQKPAAAAVAASWEAAPREKVSPKTT